MQLHERANGTTKEHPMIEIDNIIMAQKLLDDKYIDYGS